VSSSIGVRPSIKLQGLSFIGADTRKNIADHHIVISIGVVITMRIYAEVNDQLLKDINQAVKEKGIGKTRLVLEALDQYLHGSDHGELAAAISELDKTKADLDKNWSEITRLRAEITALKADLDKLRSLADKRQQESDQLRKTSDQARIDLELMKRDHEHALDTIRQDREQISMLTALTHQITEKITPALPPSKEEARAKSWWRFWK
jgi:DNA repair ATPase RecN